MSERLFPPLETTCTALADLTPPAERRAILAPLLEYLRDRLADGKAINLTFICTHNSRRSHLAQVWMQTWAQRYGLPQINCFSGGTEATAVYTTVLDTLREQGFAVERYGEMSNAVWFVKAGASLPPVAAFSKAYDHFANPSEGFAALMTCAQADAECPFIPGAERRFALDYQDPKSSDWTPGEAAAYRERSVQIGSELGYVLAKAVNHER